MSTTQMLAAIQRAMQDNDYLEDTFLKPYMTAASRSMGGKVVNVYPYGMRAALQVLLDMNREVEPFQSDYWKPPADAPAQTASKAKRLTAHEKFLDGAGLTIHAIKAVRARLGLGLKEAKDLVDRYRGR